MTDNENHNEYNSNGNIRLVIGLPCCAGVTRCGKFRGSQFDPQNERWHQCWNRLMQTCNGNGKSRATERRYEWFHFEEQLQVLQGVKGRPEKNRPGDAMNTFFELLKELHGFGAVVRRRKKEPIQLFLLLTSTHTNPCRPQPFHLSNKYTRTHECNIRFGATHSA